MTGGAQDSGALHRLVGELADALQDASNNGFGEEFFRIHVKELIERARATPAPAGWQPIESAPRDGTRFLGLTKFGVEMVKWCDGAKADNYGPHAGWIGVEQDSSCIPASFRRPNAQHQPTHWMPLPTAPAEGGV